MVASLCRGLEWTFHANGVSTSKCHEFPLNKQQTVAIITLDALDLGLTQSHITVNELMPVVVAAAIWGHRWIGHSFLVRSDNMATV